MRRDDVGGRVDVRQRGIEHRQRRRVIACRELVPHVDDQLPQPLLVRFGLPELADEAVDFRAIACARLGPRYPP